LGRLIPHPANLTPLTNLCYFAGTKFSKLFSVVYTLLLLIISDILLAYFNGYPIFSALSVFTYLGWLGIILLGVKIAKAKNFSMRNSFVFVFASEIVFWVWTNFGYWLVTSLYPKTLSGLLVCYLTALPFLRNAFIGDCIWFCVIFIGFSFAEKYFLGKPSNAQKIIES
jgi:hypothetical protein